MLPKAMAPYNNNTIIHHGITELQKHIQDIYITVGYKGPILAKHVLKYNVSGIINTNGKGNAWWLFNTILKYVNKPILVLTCDNIVTINIKVLESSYNRLGKPTCMLIPVTPIAGLEGDYIKHINNRVKKISREDKSNIYCSGMQIINPMEINKNCVNCEDFYDVWEQLIKKNLLITSSIYPEKWTSVDTLEQLNKINNDD